MPDPTGSRPDRNLALELVRVTEYGALAAARWVGLGEKESADQAAVDAMRHMLETVQMDGIVVIGEGEKDDLAQPRSPRPVARATASERDDASSLR